MCSVYAFYYNDYKWCIKKRFVAQNSRQNKRDELFVWNTGAQINKIRWKNIIGIQKYYKCFFRFKDKKYFIDLSHSSFNFVWHFFFYQIKSYCILALIIIVPNWYKLSELFNG